VIFKQISRAQNKSYYTSNFQIFHNFTIQYSRDRDWSMLHTIPITMNPPPIHYNKSSKNPQKENIFPKFHMIGASQFVSKNVHLFTLQ